MVRSVDGGAGENWRDEAVEAAVRRSIAHMMKSRARHYRRRPSALESLFPGLSIAPSATLIAVASHLVERERLSPHRWYGFGGEVTMMNARAALLLGRLRRRCERAQMSASV